MRTVLTVVAAAVVAAAPAGLYGMDAQVSLIYQYPNGTSVEIHGPIPYELQAQQLSAIDVRNQVLYVLGYNDSSTKPNLVGIDLQSGKLVSDVPLPFAEGTFVGVGQQLAVEPTTGQVIVGGVLVANGPHTVGFVNPKTGQFTEVASISSDDLPVLGGSAVYDPVTTTFVLQLGVGNSISLFSVNMKTGNVTQWPEDFETGADIQSFDYDSKTGLIFGLGLRPNSTSFTRTLVALNPHNFTYTTVGSVYDYSVMSGGIAALDSTHRLLYWIGQQTGAGENDPFYLIALSLADGSVQSASQLCANDAECPWSLEYNPGAGDEGLPEVVAAWLQAGGLPGRA